MGVNPSVQAKVQEEVEAYKQMWQEKLVRKEDERSLIVERLQDAGVDMLYLYKQLELKTAEVRKPTAGIFTAAGLSSSPS
jgi:hypothetical protein